MTHPTIPPGSIDPACVEVKEREAIRPEFEDYCTRRGYETTRAFGPGYLNYSTNCRWQAWQAATSAAALRAQAAATVKESLTDQAAGSGLDTPLPCDVTVGHGTMRKGVPLRVLVLRMKTLYKMATGHDADEVANRTPEERRALWDTSPLNLSTNQKGGQHAQGSTLRAVDLTEGRDSVTNAPTGHPGQHQESSNHAGFQPVEGDLSSTTRPPTEGKQE